MIRRRPLSALVATIALVFAQFAVSAHACAERQGPGGGEVKAHHEACHEMPAPDESPVNGNVCVEHCQYGSTSVDNAQPAPAITDPAGPVLRVEPSEAQAAEDACLSSRPAPAAAPPPPAILFGVLRI